MQEAAFMNETIRTILFRRSVRAYTDEHVPAELLETIRRSGSPR